MESNDVPHRPSIVVEENLLKDAAAAVQLLQQQIEITAKPPPEPLPMYWVVRESRSQPGYYYYFNHETGVCSWYPPQQDHPQPSSTKKTTTENGTVSEAPKYSLEEIGNLSAAVVAAATASGNTATSTTAATTTNGSIQPPEPLYPIDNSANHHSLKRSLPDGSASDVVPNKRSSVSNSSSSSSKAKSPHQVRVIHILKKHAGSRKPTSWRVPVITATKEEARAELQALLDVLRDVQDDKEELRATMEELARTESDCSSYKRNGDLGYFTRKKMQPQFEDTAFALQINELSDIIETSSGLHVLLRIG
jgi:peptidyl-prolyl cis-trans isomerase NIMA-interacting 1